MKFLENSKPIYLQIVDRVSDDVTAGKYTPGSRIPSAREYASLLQVNVNTVMRAFDSLSSSGIIFNKRGIGYFITDDAIEHISQQRQASFFEEELPYLFERMQNIGITPETLNRLYSDFYNKVK